MQQAGTLFCPKCGSGYQLTPEYLAQYGGQSTACTQCGQEIRLPRAVEMQPSGPASSPPPMSVQVLAYAGPVVAASARRLAGRASAGRCKRARRYPPTASSAIHRWTFL